MHTENFDQKINFLMTLMKLRLEFLFTDLSQGFGIYLVVFALMLFSSSLFMDMGKGWRESVVKLKVIQPQPKYKTRNFPSLIRKRLVTETFIDESKNKEEFQSATWSNYKHHRHSWISFLCFFQFNNDLVVMV